MLKGISSVISPELIKVLMEMGHGDEIVIADGNFPAMACAKRLIRLDGHDIPSILDAILKLFPLDTYVSKPVMLMQVVTDNDAKPGIWDEYFKIIAESSENKVEIEYIERFAFYERSKKAFAIVASGELALYANVILKKGIVTANQ